MSNILVVKSNGECETFKPRKIVEKLINEADVEPDLAKNIARRVSRKISDLDVDEIDSIKIRNIVNNHLIKEGEFDRETQHERLGVSVADIKDQIENGSRDNANMSHNPETIHKMVADMALKQFALIDLPSDIVRSHVTGDFHCLAPEMLIVYKIKEEIYLSTIKDFVEDYFNIEEDIFVPSFNVENKEVEWKKVVNVMKNDPSQLYKITFTRGRELICTSDHPFFKTNGQNLKKDPVPLSGLKKGLRILDVCKIPVNCEEETYRGNLVGFFLGDGFVSGSKIYFRLKKEDKIDYLKNVLENLKIEYDTGVYDDGVTFVRFTDEELFNLYKNDKIITSFDEKDSLGILGGLINSDGHIRIHGKNKIPYLEFDSANERISSLYGALLFTQGINSSQRVYKKNDENHKDFFRHIASGKRVTEFLKNIRLRKQFAKIMSSDFYHGKKIEKDTYQLSIVSIEKDKIDYTYDITVDKNHSFLSGDGLLLSGNCHDMEFYAARPANCLQSDLRFFIRNGLKVDGTGDHTSAAGPAKNIETLVNHAGQALMAAQVNLSGGQSLSLLNIFMAPYAVGLPYYRIKQAMQMLVYNLNMSYVARGGQNVFSSVNLEFGVPSFLQDEPAWGPGGKTIGTYGDYQDEVIMLNKAFTEVLIEGDSMGKPHLFPNTVYVLRDEFKGKDFYEEGLQDVHKLSAKFSTPYFLNADLEGAGIHSNAMGSMSSDTPILLKINGKPSIEYAGEAFGSKPGDDNPIISEGDKVEVMTYSSSGERSWKEIKVIIEKPPAPLLEIMTGNGKFIRVTPNHKIPVKRENLFMKIKSEEIEIGDELYELKRKKKDFNIIPEFKVLGILIKDGYVQKKKEKRRLIIKAKAQKKNELLEAIEQTNFDYKLEKSYKTLIVEIRDEKLIKAFHYYVDGSVRRFPLDYMDDFDKLGSIVRGVTYGLPSTRKNNPEFKRYYSSNKQLSHGLLVAFDILGIRYSMNIDHRSKTEGNNPIYQIRFGHDPADAIVTSIKEVPNSLPVYDLDIHDNRNYVCGWGNIHVENCRTRLNTNWTGDWDEDTLRTGNLAYVTLNIPRYALREDFYAELQKNLDLASRLLLLRRNRAEACFDNFDLNPFLMQKDVDGNPYYRIEHSTLGFGLLGLDDALRNLGFDGGLASRQGCREAERIVDFVNDYAKEQRDETGFRYTVLQTPAETTAHRFATLDHNRFEGGNMSGKKGSHYYTNSTHVPVDSKLDIIERLIIEEPFHKKTMGGHISNLYLGEEPNPEALKSFTAKIKKRDIGFWAYTNAYSFCFACYTFMKGLRSECTECNSTTEIEQYSRITGYIQQVGTRKGKSGWNKGKVEELKDRNLYNV